MCNDFEMASTLETVEVELIHVDNLNQILYDGLFLYGNLGDGCVKYEAVLEAMREKVVKQIEVVREMSLELYSKSKEEIGRAHV